MFAFRKVCWRQCLYFHCLNKKWGGGWEGRGGGGGLQRPTVITQSPSCPRQTKSRLSISQNWFSRDVLQKDEMCRMQHGKAQRVCLSCVHKENVGICLAPFVVPHFLLGRSQHFPAHTCKLNMHKFKSQPSLPPVHTRCYLESYKWLLKANIYNTIKKEKSQVCCWAVLLFGWLCFPMGLFFWCLITFGTVLQSRATAADKIGFLKFLHHRFLFFFQLCALLHLPPGKHREAEHQLLQHGRTSVTVG